MVRSVLPEIKTTQKPLNFNGYADFQGFVHFLYVKQEVDYIAVFNDIFLAF